MRGRSLARQQRLVRLLDQGDELSVPQASAERRCAQRISAREKIRAALPAPLLTRAVLVGSRA
jgi:hypothetical protein